MQSVLCARVKIFLKKHFFIVWYTLASTNRLHKIFNSSTAELKRAHIARYNFRNVNDVDFKRDISAQSVAYIGHRIT